MPWGGEVLAFGGEINPQLRCISLFQVHGRRRKFHNAFELARFGSRFGDHVVANPEADVPELLGFALYREAERQFSAV
jgi:hypothetical protein